MTDSNFRLSKEYHDELVEKISRDPLGKQILIDAEIMNEDGTEHETVTAIFKDLENRGIIKPD